MANYGLLSSFFLGICFTSALSSLPKTYLEIKEPVIPFDQQYFVPSVEKIVDFRFKLLAANFQDQINDLKGIIAPFDVTKTAFKGSMENQQQHEIRKRQTNSKRPFCEYSGSLCTFFYPDHPDASRKKGSYSPTTNYEMLQDPTKVKGAPSSCKDLQLLGHQLNGLYLIKTSQPSQGTKIDTVFCDFQSAIAPSVSQDLIGTVDVKTKSVHFYVQRNTSFSSTTSPALPFELARLNQGGAFNLTSGIFTAPVAGIYHFDFSVLKDDNYHVLGLQLQVNGVDVAAAYTNQGKSISLDVASLSSTLRLKENDRVSLCVKDGGLIDNQSHHTHFTGWLVEEDLM